MKQTQHHQQEIPWWKKIVANIPWTTLAATAAGFLVAGIPGAIIGGGLVLGYKGYKSYQARKADQNFSAPNPMEALNSTSKQLTPQQPTKKRSFQQLHPDAGGKKPVLFGKSKTID